jgi:hypothetical protein
MLRGRKHSPTVEQSDSRAKKEVGGRSETSTFQSNGYDVPAKIGRKRHRIAGNNSSHTPARWLWEGTFPARGPASPNAPRKKVSRHTKRAMVLEMMSRPGGASLAAISAITGWQAHSVRALVATLGKHAQFKVGSTKKKKGERMYTICDSMC